jgi:hypothetical protein
MISDQRERVFYFERQLALVGGPAALILLTPKIVNFFTMISDQRERVFYFERQLALVGGPAALWCVIIMVHFLAPKPGQLSP